MILPRDIIYDEARKVYNAMIDKHPAIIVKCLDVADVTLAVKFGRDNKLPVAVRGGGHNGGGLGLVDDGLVIDLSGIKFVRVNTANTPCAWAAEISGVKWIMRHMLSDLRFLRVSFPPRASADLHSAAA